MAEVLIHTDKSRYEGKTIKEIKTNCSEEIGMVMRKEIKIIFTDGDYIMLRTEWRGDECYISQFIEPEDSEFYKNA